MANMDYLSIILVYSIKYVLQSALHFRYTVDIQVIYIGVKYIYIYICVYV